MRTTLTDNTLTIYPEGRIDSNNAMEEEQKIMSAVGEAPGADIVLDARTQRTGPRSACRER